MIATPPCRRAFSLIEIVLAIGIISFAGVAIIGLLGVGLNSSRESTEETACGLVARYVFTELQTDALSAEDLSSTRVSPFNPANTGAGLTKTYYFTRDGVFVGNSLPNSSDPAREPFFVAEAVITSPPAALAAGVANQGVSGKELRAVALTVNWPLNATTGAAPAKGKDASYGFLLSKALYRKSLEGDR